MRAIERADDCIIIDDSIYEKPYTDENDIIRWHYDHSQDRMVKGINFLSAIYHVPQLDEAHPEVSLPAGLRLVAKTKRRDPVSKNEHYQVERWDVERCTITVKTRSYSRMLLYGEIAGPHQTLAAIIK
ncbi:MAG: hypothetical protein IVW55_06590 [Chloroflexi bacterium]|nr:hypothetical protein [Chloroflexota bacterium]